MGRNTKSAVGTVRRLLQSQSTLALSTFGEGGPHVTPLFYLVGPDLELYWFSSSSSLHSRNLAEDPRASGAVYRSTETWREICGVQMQGEAQKVTDRALRRRIAGEYCERFRLGTLFRTAMARSVLYVFRPAWIRYLDNRQRFGFKFEITAPFCEDQPRPKSYPRD